ncbi:hypothetical protein [Actinoplanes subglobosus]|uniref:Uncharacterized protein n=1 Tax=Actinoplanes subglobosus TaxID=1547892 RepID=A0ABV8IHH3_9ACTN
MTSFPALARLVRDVSLPPHRRRSRLRNCIHHFAPLGFTATWNHLEAAHRIPRRIEKDPDSLVRALDELEAARALVLPRAVAFADRRRAEKQEGRRSPATLHPWNSWGCNGIAYCPEPQTHPGEPLPLVVGRVLDACEAGVSPVGRCFVCGDEARRPRRACRICGVQPGGRGTPL